MMFNPFKTNIEIFKPKIKLGIDIGTASIKIVELGKEGGRFNLTNYGIFELRSLGAASQEAKSKGLLKLPDAEVVWGIKEILKKANITSKDVVASIPSFSTFATVIELPYLSTEDLARAVQFEAKKYIPIPLNSVVLDWSIIDSFIPGQQPSSADDKLPATKPSKQNPSMVDIFIAAVPIEETVKYQNIMKNAGLNLRALELENSALIRSLMGNDLSTTAIVNIGGRSTSITIVSRGFERVSHNYDLGGFEITRAIARSLNISLERADELKMKFGLKEGEENVINDSIVSLIDMMAFETKKTIAHYEESKNKTISKILLVGGVANIPNFIEYFKGRLGREVLPGNPLSRITYSSELAPAGSNLGNMLSVAIGLAMREL